MIRIEQKITVRVKPMDLFKDEYGIICDIKVFSFMITLQQAFFREVVDSMAIFVLAVAFGTAYA